MFSGISWEYIKIISKSITQLLADVEKRFLDIRGWKNWEEYDNVRESSELDKNVRSELMLICIDETKKDATASFRAMLDEVQGSCDLICWQITPQNFIKEIKARLPDEVKDE